MPRAPKRCGRDRCENFAPCPDHRPKKRPSGRYSKAHGRDRDAWAPIVATGTVACRRGEQCLRFPETLIPAGAPWDLGHPDAECPAPTAPEHMRCNRAAPGRLR